MSPTFADLETQAVPLNRGQARRITDVLEPMVVDAVERFARGQLVDYQLIAQAMPNPAQTQRWEPMVLIFVTIASASGLDDRRVLNHSQPLPMLTNWAQEQVDAVIKEMLDGCFATRDQELAQFSEQVPERTSAAGLVLPG